MKPKDRIALIIAVGLITWGVIGLGGLVYRNKTLGETGGEVLVAIGGALVAMLATYLASNGKDNDKK